MNVKIRVNPLRQETHKLYDLFVATLGYETRSSFISKKADLKATKNIAIGFTSDQILKYQLNKSWFESAGFEVVEVEDKAFIEVMARACNDACDTRATPEKGRVRIAVDISSVTRLRMALILQFLGMASGSFPIEVDFYYALAEFSDPPSRVQANTHVGPVLPSLSGWWTEPERPVAAAVGLGYEENRALGAVEHIQASAVFTFIPRSPVQAYTPALHVANRTLLQQVRPENRFEYDVAQPVDTFIALESFAFGITRSHNLILLPFGPKIFALTSMLVAIVHPDVAVWRVSGSDEKVDRHATGEIFGLSVDFGEPKAFRALSEYEPDSQYVNVP